MIRISVLALLMAMCLCGCAEVLNKVVIPPNIQTTELSSITVCRQRVFFGDGATTTFFLDQVPILKTPAGHCFSAKIPSGQHSIFVNNPEDKIIFNIAKGESKFFVTLLVVNSNATIYEQDVKEIDGFSGYKQVKVQD